MDSNQRWVDRWQRSGGKRQVMDVVDNRSIEMQTKIAIIRRQRHFCLFNDEFLSNPAVSDQILDRTNLQAKLILKSEELRQARHCAIVVDDLSQDAGRMEIC